MLLIGVMVVGGLLVAWLQWSTEGAGSVPAPRARAVGDEGGDPQARQRLGREIDRSTVAVADAAPSAGGHAAADAWVVVEDCEGRPQAGARVAVHGVGGEAEATTDVAGRAALSGLGVGAYQILIRGPQVLSRAVFRDLPDGGAPVWRVEVPCGALLAGRVIGGDGRPQDGALVIPLREQAVGNAEFERAAAVRTGVDGRFELVGETGQPTLVLVEIVGCPGVKRRLDPGVGHNEVVVPVDR